MSVRGAIHTPSRAKQLNDFSELAIGTITPTDLDGLIDYHGESFAFFEVKGQGASMSFGQSLALTRVVDLIQKAGKRAALFEVEHDEPNPGRSVNAARCLVRRTYFEGAWRDREGWTMTLRQAVDAFLGLVIAPVAPVAAAATPEPAAPIALVQERVEPPTVDEIFGGGFK